MFLLLVFVYLCLTFNLAFTENIDSINDKCSKANTCDKCMAILPNCYWCYSPDFQDTKYGAAYRCATNYTLVHRGCSEKYLANIESKLHDDDQASSAANADRQIFPSGARVDLRPGQPITTNWHFRSQPDYPVDLYFLIDLSYTMRDDLETVSKLTADIAREMSGVTRDLRIGFGAFVDKPFFPFVVPTRSYLLNPCQGVGEEQVICDPPFLFKHILSLTSNFEEFRRKTILSRPSGNLDNPEGGLDALLQVAVCNRDVGWRSHARKIVLYASDGGFHLAGDGRIAGLVMPARTSCQLSFGKDRFNSSIEYFGWHNFDETDYPSVGELASTLRQNSISVIFATVPEFRGLYTRLAMNLPSAAVGVLSDSSLNIVRLVRENYDKIANRVEMVLTYDKNLLKVDVFTKCAGESSFLQKTVCPEQPIGGRVDYRIRVEALKQFVSKENITISIVTLEEKAMLNVTAACNCLASVCASFPPVLNSARCSDLGDLVCGSCECPVGWSGEFCECRSTEISEIPADQTSLDAAMLAKCTRPGDKDVCSSRGRCICGICKCDLGRYDGNFCECDRAACRRSSDDNQVCGGPERGVCQCDGSCKCLLGYTGDRCDCALSEAACLDARLPDGPKCSGRGICDCGQCFCDSGYTGTLCNELQGGEAALCTDRTVLSCVTCLRQELLGKNGKIGPSDTEQLHLTSGETPLASYEYKDGESPQIANEWKLSLSPLLKASAVCNISCHNALIDATAVRIEQHLPLDDGGDLPDSQSGSGSSGYNLCIVYTDDNCREIFTYSYPTAVYLKRKANLTLIQERECTQTIEIWWIVLGVVGGIFLGGLIMLLIYKLVITVEDRRELAIFDQHNKAGNWATAENPLYVGPATRIKNPAFDKREPDRASLAEALPMSVRSSLTPISSQ